jgi:hypothetical protein
MRRLIWSSIPSPSFSATRLNQIITPSRRNNRRDHISGMLLFTGAHFLGLLEGADLDLRDLWLRLERDTRHCDLLRIDDELCAERWFLDWKMGYLASTEVDAQIESFHALQTQIDLDRAGAGAQVETLPLPEARSTPKWGRIVRPIMLSADSM